MQLLATPAMQVLHGVHELRKYHRMSAPIPPHKPQPCPGPALARKATAMHDRSHRHRNPGSKHEEAPARGPGKHTLTEHVTAHRRAPIFAEGGEWEELGAEQHHGAAHHDDGEAVAHFDVLDHGEERHFEIIE